MHLYQSLVSLAAISSLALANPIPERLAKRAGRFTVSQRQTKHTLRLGAVAHRRTYLKYGVTPPEHLHLAAEAAIKAQLKPAAANGTGQGTVEAEPAENDSEYLSPVSVAGTELMLDFDTGSADLWVYSSLQPSSETQGHATYTANSADEEQGQTWMIQYGDGSSAGGNVYTGTVEIGGVTATSQAIEAATSISAAFQQDADSDGLVGLAFDTLNQVTPTAQKTFFSNVMDQLESPLFTAYLKKGETGSYDFGFINQSKYTGEITYADADSSNGFWEVPVTGYAVATGSEVSSSFSAVIDTGSSLWYMPTEAVQAYYAAVPSAQEDATQGGYVFDCSETLPSMSVTIGGTSFTVDGTLMNYASISGTGTGGSCFGGVQDGAGLPYMIFGDVFLKSVLAVFDSQGPRVGFATQAGSGSGASGNGSSTSPSPSSSSLPSSLPSSSPSSLPSSLPSSVPSSVSSSPSATGSSSSSDEDEWSSQIGDLLCQLYGMDCKNSKKEAKAASNNIRIIRTRLGRPAAPTATS